MVHQLQHNILYSCEENTRRSNEQLVVEHTFGYIMSGETHFYSSNGLEIVKEGTVGLIRRNHLAKSVKIPAATGVPFKSISIFLDQESLKRYSAEHNIHIATPYTGDPMTRLPEDPFIKSYFISLEPYFVHPGKMTDALADLKTREAIELLLRLNPSFKNFLFDFSEPFKIDLESYMNQHFMFNIPLSQFARLTGRSLATYKRDFQKIFAMSPERWLLKKRLEQAHFLISQKNQKPIDVYHEVGFENISHFSTSFKNLYGYTPSSLKFEV
jgi:AraC-like DNA-binding protein